MPSAPKTDAESTDPVAPLVAIREPGRVTIHLVVREPIEIGRDCAGLLVDDPQVSRRHVALRPSRDRVWVEDLGSSNGTFVDGVRIDAPIEMEPGSAVVIGDTTIEISGERAMHETGRSLDEPPPRTSIDRVAAAAAADRRGAAGGLGGGTQTIAFSDIEASTEKTVALGDARWFEVLSAHEALMHDAVESHRGVVVKSQGDGFMLAFASARLAVRCMIAVQQRIRALEAVEPESVKIRVGLHTGEAIADDDGDLFGQSVIIAARIANAATGGEILVSSLVREIIEPRGDIAFGDSRSVHLKGIAGGHVVHPIAWWDRPELPD